MTHTISTPAAYIGAGVTVVAGLSINEWAAVIGIVLAIATFCLNWYYKHKESKRKDK